VYGLITARWPGRFENGNQVTDRTSLGTGGLGLDSIEIVELVLECEEQLGVAATRTEELLEAGPITVGRLIDHLAAN
jgi:acyl carrier protein